MPKTNYLPYVGVYDTNRAVVKESFKGASEEELEETTLRFADKVMTTKMAEDRRTPMQLEMLSMLDELNWRKLGRDILFPSKGLVEALLASGFEVDRESFKTPFRIFSVSVPRDMSWRGIRIHPFLVTYDTSTQRQESYDAVYLGNGMLPMPIDSDRPDELCMRITFTSPVTMPDGMKTRAIHRSSFPGEMMEEILSCAKHGTDPGDAISIAGTMEKIRCLPLDEKERNEMFLAFKLAVGLSLFIQSFPDSMVDGLPKDYTVSTGRLPKGSRPRSIGHGIPGSEDRRGSGAQGPRHCGMYFRSYPKRSDGSRKPGIVEVSGYWTKGKTTPHTVAQEVGA